MGPGDLARALCGLERIEDPNLLTGLTGFEDAGVYRLSDETALVQTLDFFTPIVDDPYLFGAIAAANALSDVYAMGGRPLCAMNIVCFPVKTLPIEVLRETLRGGLDKLREAGVALAGGHSIEDAEFKFGLSVTGLVHPDRIWRNQGARPGDSLVLTKPIGTGIVATAVKAGDAGAEAAAEIAVSMAALNRRAAELAAGYPVHACTDVTGFGLLGHVSEMLGDQPIGIILFATEVQLFGGVVDYCEQGLAPGGLHRNKSHYGPRIDLDPSLDGCLADVLHDPQTSGGLLLALPSADARRLLAELTAAGLAGTSIVGEVVPEPAGRIVVR